MSLINPSGMTQQQLAITPQLVNGVTLGQSTMVISPVIDAFAAPGVLTTVIPALGAGIRFVSLTNRILIVTRTGTITGNPAGKAGNNVNHDNLSPTITLVPSAVQISAADPGDFAGLSLAVLTGKATIFGSPALATDVVYEQVTAATGTATLTFQIALTGFFAAFA